jgi:nucleotide-binding universal stress UspA family protein
MTAADPHGPYLLRFDGSEAAERAEELDSPAIVMGQRGRSAIKSAILGSVSRDVVNAFHRPVILV